MGYHLFKIKHTEHYLHVRNHIFQVLVQSYLKHKSDMHTEDQGQPAGSPQVKSGVSYWFSDLQLIPVPGSSPAVCWISSLTAPGIPNLTADHHA